MNKIEFINFLKKHAENAGVYRGRFVPYSNSNEDYWSYVRPAVDCFEPTINLSKDGVVEYVNYGDKTEFYTYEDFIKFYKLTL